MLQQLLNKKLKNNCHILFKLLQSPLWNKNPSLSSHQFKMYLSNLNQMKENLNQMKENLNRMKRLRLLFNQQSQLYNKYKKNYALIVETRVIGQKNADKKGLVLRISRKNSKPSWINQFQLIQFEKKLHNSPLNFLKKLLQHQKKFQRKIWLFTKQLKLEIQVILNGLKVFH